MKSSAIISALVGAAATLAAPPSQLARRGTLARSFPKAVTGFQNETNNEYSSNWSGAVLIGTGFTQVTGTIVVPTIPAASGGTKYGSAWVGIDGDTCNALWQTGISWEVTGSQVTYDGWYEWIPEASIDYGNFAISAGDTIRMTIVASSKTGGTAKLENLTTGKTVTHTDSSKTPSLCEYNAEWIVEDFSLCSDSSCQQTTLAPFANYGTVTFTSASAVKSGSTVGVTGATLIDLSTNGASSGVLSHCTNTASTVTCKYV